MPDEKRRTLTAAEKTDLREKNKNCYICLEPLMGYADNEIEYDHIYSYADGYPQDLTNFAPVHASSDPHKRNCHAEKGRKSPVEYREELRIKRELEGVTGIKDLLKNALPSVYTVSASRDSIEFNGEILRLYNQHIGGQDNYYFYHVIDTKYIENDDGDCNYALSTLGSWIWSSISSRRYSYCPH